LIYHNRCFILVEMEMEKGGGANCKVGNSQKVIIRTNMDCELGKHLISLYCL